MTVGKYLPRKEAVLAACRGWPLADNPVLESACELATIYESQNNLLLDVDDIVNNDRYQELGRIMDWAELVDTVVCDRRDGLIASIDEWVDLVVPAASPTAPLHAETVGLVVDRLALLTVRSYVAFANEPGPVARAVHAQLYANAAGYEELADVLSAGMRRLPSPQRQAGLRSR
ncbi:DUF4254 domain-containing protein [Nocardia sp. NPDC049220]|uniref:DUF4254 domain-containing protein n=1 Tax=Nocardia sp. NPDC049220 TaxID=3155273 RepID=UPI0033ECC4F9